MPSILDITTVLPDNGYTQDELIGALEKMWTHKSFNFARVEQIHKNVQVKKRYLSLPIERYKEFSGFGEKNKAWIETATNLCEKACLEMFETHSIDPKSVKLMMSSTVTGISVPSVEARLMNRLPFDPHTKRVPLMGLGCLAGAAGINRLADYLVGHPKEMALLFCVELCSLTFQFDDTSAANFVSTGLFSDGAACLCMVGDEHPLASKAPFKWLAGQSVFFPETERAMGWDIVDSGFKIVLGKEVPYISEELIPKALEAFLKERKLSQKDLAYYVAHPGGPKVLQSLQKGLGLSDHDLRYSWQGLSDYGNMSSASILFIFKEFFKKRPSKNSLGLTMAMGPAFCAEMGLIQCQQ